MLEPITDKLREKKIYLASGSKSRRDLLKMINLDVEVLPSKFEENLDKEQYTFSEYVEETALKKVEDVENQLVNMGESYDVIIGSDTIVTFDDEILEKPKDTTHAREMLTKLSGNTNRVYTGVVIKVCDQDKPDKFTVYTDVTFGVITNEHIERYINSGEPMDKAGAYAIQGLGGTFIKRIEGDYYSVMGMPLYDLCSKLYDMFKVHKS